MFHCYLPFQKWNTRHKRIKGSIVNLRSYTCMNKGALYSRKLLSHKKGQQ